jgi:hypothetical protein
MSTVDTWGWPARDCMAATACDRAAAAALGFIPADGLNVVVVVDADDVRQAERVEETVNLVSIQGSLAERKASVRWASLY